jgi:hypothetical protein
MKNSERTKIQRNVSSGILIILVVLLIGGGIALYDGIGYYKEKKRLYDSIFPTMKNVEIKVERQKNLLSKKPFEKIEIDIKSLASEKDGGKNADKANQVINREELDKGIPEWLLKSYNEKEAKKIADEIVIKYLGRQIIPPKE